MQKKVLLLAAQALFSVNVMIAENVSGHATEKIVLGTNDNSGITEIADTTRSLLLDELFVESTTKEGVRLRKLPLSVSVMNSDVINANGVKGLKNIGMLMPNFYVPDYGSRQTNSIYVRGIGSRIGTPAVGMYVDEVAYYSSSIYDFNMSDIESIQILRGPQSSLYGRNTMGGLIKINTRNPFNYSGTDLHVGFASKNNDRNVSLSHYHRVNDGFAFSASGFYEGNDGLFKNTFLDKMADALESGGGRLRAIWKASHKLKFDASIGFQHVNGGAYPYFHDGAITANLEGRYRRNMLNANVNTTYATEKLTLTSVTSFQHLNDRMFMDQDFMASDIYSLEQRQHVNTLSEEFVMKNNISKWWKPLTGINIFYQWQNTKAPVTFNKDGLAWLNNIINTNANTHLPQVQAGPMTMSFNFADNIQGDNVAFDTDFDLPTFGAALFHQSTFNNILGIDGLSAALGMRLDYEKLSMDYHTLYDFNHKYSLNGHLSGMKEMDITMVPENTYNVLNSSLTGKTSNDYLNFLPKFSLMYEFKTGNAYASVSRGFRSGGYNAQNISELLRTQMQVDMMKDVRDQTIPVLENQQAVPGQTKEDIKNILNGMAADKPANVESTCSYKPEYAWNYEVGTHLNLIDRRLQMDFSVFLSNVTNLQLSQMSETGLGRSIINAGRSRSAGFEYSLMTRPVDELMITANYGFTYSTFRDYSDYDAANNLVNCRGNYVPFVPKHTFSMDVAYTLYDNENGGLLGIKSFAVGANMNGAGRIYWDELNTASQSLYTLFGARAIASFKDLSVQLWGRNLGARHYNTFWFQSMGRNYEQHGKPLQVGIDVNVHF